MFKDVGLTLTLQSNIEFLLFSWGKLFLQSEILETWSDRGLCFTFKNSTEVTIICRASELIFCCSLEIEYTWKRTDTVLYEIEDGEKRHVIIHQPSQILKKLSVGE